MDELEHERQRTEALRERLRAVRRQLQHAEQQLGKLDRNYLALRDREFAVDLVALQDDDDGKPDASSSPSATKGWVAHAPPATVSLQLSKAMRRRYATARLLSDMVPDAHAAEARALLQQNELWVQAGRRGEAPALKKLATASRRSVQVHTAGTVLRVLLPPSGDMTFRQLLESVALMLGVTAEDFSLQTDFSKPCSPDANVEQTLVEVAILGDGTIKRQLTAKEAFRMFDTDDSGEIDLPEFMALFQHINPLVPRDRLMRMFDAVDSDQSGSIVFPEFSAAWPMLLRMMQEALSPNLPPVYLIPKRRFGTGAADGRSSRPKLTPQLAWEVFDRDASQEIEFQEFAEVFMHHMNSRATYRQLRRLFNLIDTDRSGRIDYGEFEAHWDLIIAELAKARQAVDAEEVMDDLGKALGWSVLQRTSRGPLPPQQAGMVRGAALFLCFMAMFAVLLLVRHDLAGAFRTSTGVRTPATTTYFGGPRLWPNGSVDTTLGQTGYSVSELQPYFSYWRDAFPAIKDEQSLWQWARGPLKDVLFGAGCSSAQLGLCGNGKIGDSALVVGLLRLQQRRRPRSCPPDPDSPALARFVSCQPQLQSPRPLVLDLPHNASLFFEIVPELQAEGWITRETEHVWLTATLFNPNTNFFLTARFHAFTTPAGRFTTSSTFRTVRVDMFAANKGKLMLALQLVLLVLAGAFAAMEMRRMKQDGNERGPQGVATFFNVLTIAISVTFMASLCCQLAYYFLPARDNFDILTQRFVDLQPFARLYNAAQALDGLVALMGFAKLLDYLRVGGRWEALWDTITLSVRNSVYFCVLFGALLVGFVTLAHQLYGETLHEFSTFLLATRALTLMVLGKFDYESMKDSQRVWTPVFVLTFVFIMFFIYRNVFVAIVNDAFSQRMLALQRTFQYDMSAWSTRAVLGALIPALAPSKPRVAVGKFGTADVDNAAVENLEKEVRAEMQDRV